MNNKITNEVIDLILDVLQEKQNLGYDLKDTIKEIEKMKIMEDDFRP
jgi:hypothetical protein